MSRFSVYLRSRYSIHGEAVDFILRRWLGKWSKEIIDHTAQLVALLDMAEEGGRWKKETATIIIRGILAKYHLKVPDWLLNYLIERVLAILQTRSEESDPEPEAEPDPAPPPVDEPPNGGYEVIFYTEPDYNLYASGDKVYVDNAASPTLWYVVPGTSGTPLLPTTLSPTVWKVVE